MHLFDSTVKAGMYSLRYLLTYKLGQDHFRTLFAVCSRGGLNKIPSALQSGKRLLLLKDGANGNSIPQDSSNLMAIASRIKKARVSCRY